MKISEIKTASNDDLILELSFLLSKIKVTKTDQKIADRVVDELIKRGIVSSDFKTRYTKIFYS